MPIFARFCALTHSPKVQRKERAPASISILSDFHSLPLNCHQEKKKKSYVSATFPGVGERGGDRRGGRHISKERRKAAISVQTQGNQQQLEFSLLENAT